MVSVPLFVCRQLFGTNIKLCYFANMSFPVGERNPNMESLYEYGSRAGFWRFHRLFTSRKIPITVFAVGMVRSSTIISTFVLNPPDLRSSNRRWNGILPCVMR